MTKKSPSRFQIVTGLLAVSVLLAAGTPVRADDAIDTKIFRGILEGLGLKKDDGKGNGIEYRERSPLVIPPGNALPNPQTDAAALGNPAWPIDADIQRAKSEQAGRDDPEQFGSNSFITNARPLPQEKLTPGARGQRRSASASPSAEHPSEYDSKRPMMPDQLGYKGGLFKNMFSANSEETTKFTHEPPRATLTSPPPGYQTPAASHPYGLGAKKVIIKPLDPADKGLGY